jgi:hypothetical protein
MASRSEMLVVVREFRDGGMGIKEISKRLEIGVGSVYGAMKDA